MRFIRCAHGHDHFGPLGAAGLLLTRDEHVMLQCRSQWVHHGGTWSTPGGALNAGETDTQCALREASEELGLSPSAVDVLDLHRSDCGGWTYTTVIGRLTRSVSFMQGWESSSVAWFHADEVSTLTNLHPSFATNWPAIREVLTCTAS